MLQILQLGIELHRLEEPFRPKEQRRVVEWKRRSSLPSATHRGCFLVDLDLMESRYSSNFAIVLGVFWTFRMRSILQTGDCFLSQLDWNMISTMFLLVSSAPSSDTGSFENRKQGVRIVIILYKYHYYTTTVFYFWTILLTQRSKHNNLHNLSHACGTHT
ncbi:hypothetical protein RHMOL_Rhmol06G0147700 [Rhododendron molle]|uniref:Uncharacterized protein n=1 Tax=Rhododendron molle TaxID=49168 RepID=A0ACC0NCJ0_RHOML|nr:hypothetical protein RHMOL_Rhmol06G0147700 [Rhododendron molle]